MNKLGMQTPITQKQEDLIVKPSCFFYVNLNSYVLLRSIK